MVIVTEELCSVGSNLNLNPQVVMASEWLPQDGPSRAAVTALAPLSWCTGRASRGQAGVSPWGGRLAGLWQGEQGGHGSAESHRHLHGVFVAQLPPPLIRLYSSLVTV